MTEKDVVYFATNAGSYHKCVADSYDELYEIIKEWAAFCVENISAYAKVEIERNDPYVFLTYTDNDGEESCDYFYMYKLVKGQMH